MTILFEIFFSNFFLDSSPQNIFIELSKQVCFFPLKKLSGASIPENLIFLFSRRMERLLEDGFEEEYLDLTKKLLAQRPSNYEAWDRMGKLHERRNEFDLAWFCYDQAQAHSTSLKSRDEFRARMESQIDGRGKVPWKSPDITDRVEFLTRMQSLAENKHQETNPSNDESTDETELTELQIAEELLTKDRISEAFFIARRLAAEGDSKAMALTERIQEMMRNG